MAATEVVLVGARGLARELLGYLESDARFRVVCALDDDTSIVLPGCDVVSPRDWDGRCDQAFFTMGYPEHKRDVLEQYAGFGFRWLSYVHPLAVVSRHATLGAGCIVAPFTVVAGNAVLEDFVFMNVYAAVGHDTKVGRFSSLMPYACLEGYGTLGEECLIATGGKVLPKVQVGDRSRVSAGAVVMRHMPADTLIHGNPATSSPDVAMLRRRAKKSE